MFVDCSYMPETLLVFVNKVIQDGNNLIPRESLLKQMCNQSGIDCDD